MGPKASLAGRRIGMDFDGIDGWRMYHGQRIPGFPQHPHRGFETVTIVREGFIDHSDSLGATARYGDGDLQWLTAGRGIVHAEMFPLLRSDGPNPLELFQIWLNLPAASKMCEPYFKMLWSQTIPTVELEGASVQLMAGSYQNHRPPSPPPNSWAAHDASDVAIWTIKLKAGGRFTLPSTFQSTARSLYLFDGTVNIGDASVNAVSRIALAAESPTELRSTPGAELLLLQGKPIGESVAFGGPFVMNTRAELERAFADYERTQFGGWPWDRDDHVLPIDAPRHAQRTDGTIEYPQNHQGAP